MALITITSSSSPSSRPCRALAANTIAAMPGIHALFLERQPRERFGVCPGKHRLRQARRVRPCLCNPTRNTCARPTEARHRIRSPAIDLPRTSRPGPIGQRPEPARDGGPRDGGPDRGRRRSVKWKLSDVRLQDAAAVALAASSDGSSWVVTFNKRDLLGPPGRQRSERRDHWHHAGRQRIEPVRCHRCRAGPELASRASYPADA